MSSLDKIKVAELFYSLQGEGYHVGVPSVFLRVFGCNLRCPMYGTHVQPNDKGYNAEVVEIIDTLKNYRTYGELPLVKTGCDSYASVYPEFKNFSRFASVSEIADKIQKMLPSGKFGRDTHMIFTGGEPLLGWQKQYISLIEEMKSRKMNLEHVTFETNGTQKLSPDLSAYLSNPDNVKSTTFAVSAKLPKSGHGFDVAIQPEAVVTYKYVRESLQSFFKFVISHPEDIYDVIEAEKRYLAGNIDWPIYLMPAGGEPNMYAKNATWVAELAKEYGYRFSPRTQVTLWGNAWAT